MRVRVEAFRPAIIAVATLASPVAAHAQALPPAVRAAGVTEAQWQQTQLTIRAQSTTLGLREDVIRTLAVEVFQAQPGQPVDRCIALIREGAARLPQVMAAAQALAPSDDPMLARLKADAIAAAQAGRLREALALQDRYAAALRAALNRAILQPQLNLAAADAASAESAYALGDYLGAAQRYATAAEEAPASETHVVWGYRIKQAWALIQRGHTFLEPAALQQAIRVLSDEAQPLAPRETAPMDWAKTQNDLGAAHTALTELSGDPEALQRAVAHYRAALEVRTRSAAPAEWAATQYVYGHALTLRAERGDAPAFSNAAAAYRAALEVQTRDADPIAWAKATTSLGNINLLLGQQGNQQALNEALSAYHAVLEVHTRAAAPQEWAFAQLGLANAMVVQGRNRQDQQILREAIAAYQTVFEVYARDGAPADWATTEQNLAFALQSLGELGDQQALHDSEQAYFAALAVQRRTAAPEIWAQTLENLSVVQLMRGESGDQLALFNLIATVTELNTVHTRERAPSMWVANQTRLAQAFMNLGVQREQRFAQMNGIQDWLDNAVATYQTILDVSPRATAPLDWADAQYGIAYAKGVQVEHGDRTKLREATAAARGALEEYQNAHDEQAAALARDLVAWLEGL